MQITAGLGLIPEEPNQLTPPSSVGVCQFIHWRVWVLITFSKGSSIIVFFFHLSTCLSSRLAAKHHAGIPLMQHATFSLMANSSHSFFLASFDYWMQIIQLPLAFYYSTVLSINLLWKCPLAFCNDRLVGCLWISDMSRSVTHLLHVKHLCWFAWCIYI